MSIIDRYVMRQVLMPFLLGLLVFTFIFIIPPLLQYAERLTRAMEGLANGFRPDTVNVMVAHLLAHDAVVGSGGGERELYPAQRALADACMKRPPGQHLRHADEEAGVTGVSMFVIGKALKANQCRIDGSQGVSIRSS